MYECLPACVCPLLQLPRPSPDQRDQSNRPGYVRLFADSKSTSRIQLCSDATESTEDRRYCTEDLPESDQELLEGVLRHSSESPTSKRLSIDDRRLSEERVAFMNELLDQWETMFNPLPKHLTKSQWMIADDVQLLRPGDSQPADSPRKGEGDRVVTARPAFTSSVVKFASDCLQDYLLENCTRLSEIHVKLVQQLILASFELARELQVVPKKIQYVATQERQLFETIYKKFSSGDKKQELVQLMQDVLEEIKDELNNMDWSVDDLPWHQDHRSVISNSTFYQSCRPAPDQPSDGEEAVSYDCYSFDDYDIINSESLGLSRSYREPVQSSAEHIPIANESEMFSMSLSDSSMCTTGDYMSVKQASLDVQRTVLSKLSRKISLKLVTFVDCLKDTYFGTLQRCLDGLESSCRAELGGRPASGAMRELLSVARQVDLQPCASFSTLRTLLEAARRLFHRLRIVGGEDDGACCVMSPVWRRQTALHTQHSLSGARLARLMCAQILERLTVAHERYQSALTSLETALTNRLHHTEDVKLAIRKKYAPSFARLCLESTSMCDLLMYGTPELGREIGRGQYGVVYLARGSWGGHTPVAVKSVLPADERHYKELAMEFFYTRSIPPHPRIVAVHGSVVQRRAGGAPGVLLVSERRARDLHAAVRAGLSYPDRMRVAIDIVEGIRYLHSLGLVHRDIKMKNVLLDTNNRAALSDLGFCAAEALMSGSVVGTPVHMAPELLAGEYDAAVDVYAFGILFWYLCAGNIKLPGAFETFQNKEQLWSKVKRGLRPERLPHFTDACWAVMESCWASEPANRALLGDVQPQLEAILQHALTANDAECCVTYTGFDTDDDSLDMTGIEH
ncbi:dual serine/threonine and tyrosine protein kinase-like [Choristoneura fumiferana]|uniref:dual serine/threonine and tyrosine protein kinase-like n=1 Tax=Choristoneura fumiferana TaxID=7141 RepID=UPI003D155AB9